MRPSFSVTELVPHRPPMVLIDEILDFDEESRSLTAAIDVREEWKGNYVAIEYMAQTAAAVAGYFDKLENSARPARPGFLLGTRRLTLDLPEFKVGARYLVKATNEFVDENSAAFSCSIEDASGAVVATATLNAFRPDDIGTFLG